MDNINISEQSSLINNVIELFLNKNFNNTNIKIDEQNGWLRISFWDDNNLNQIYYLYSKITDDGKQLLELEIKNNSNNFKVNLEHFYNQEQDKLIAIEQKVTKLFFSI